ncbi:unnamed protein product [Closterium sp. Naga37s-1]|nr:unnamed protein product [Closterium sp. Naga37s-1]
MAVRLAPARNDPLAQHKLALLRALRLPLEVVLGGEAGEGQAEGGTGRRGEGDAGQEAGKGRAGSGGKGGAGQEEQAEQAGQAGQAELDALLMAARVLELNHDEFYFLASPPRAPVSPRNELQSLRRIRLALLPLLHPLPAPLPPSALPPSSAACAAPVPLSCAPEGGEKGRAVAEAMMGEVWRRLGGLGGEAGGEAAGRRTGGETAGERGKGEKCEGGDVRGEERGEGEDGEKREEGQGEAERLLMEWAVAHGATCELDVRGAVHRDKRWRRGEKGREGGWDGGRGGEGERRGGDVFEFPGTGRGMAARGAMEAGEAVLSIPLPLIISPLTALASPLVAFSSLLPAPPSPHGYGQALRAGGKGAARSIRAAPEQCEEAEGIRVQSGEVESGRVQGREAVGEAQNREAEAGAEADLLRGDGGGGSGGGKERGEEEDTDMGGMEDGVDLSSISDESIALLWTIQQRHDPSSFYAPFFNALPAAINTALTWPETAVRAVQGTLLHTHIGRARQHIHAEYHSLFPALSQRYPSLFPPALFSLSAFTAAAELWYAYAMRIALPSPPPPPHAAAAASSPSAPAAAALLLSMQGAWQLGGGGAGQAGETTALPCLVPLASLLNHSLYPHITHFSTLEPAVPSPSPLTPSSSASTSSPASASPLSSSSVPPPSTSSLHSTSHRLNLRLERPVRAGQQCFLSYGPLPSHDLALFYGFLLPSRNPYDCFPLADACREDTAAAAAALRGVEEAAAHDSAAVGSTTAKKPRHSDDASGAGSHGCTTDTATEANDASAAFTTRDSYRDSDKDRGKGGAAAGGQGEEPVVALSQHLLRACDLTLTPAGAVVERDDGERAEETVENDGEDKEDGEECEGAGGGGSEDVWGALPWRLCVALCGAVGGSMEERRMWKADALRPPQADIPPAVRSAALSTLLDLRYRMEQEQLLLSIRNECVRLLMLL